MSKGYLVNIVFSVTFVNLAIVGMSTLSLDGTLYSMVRTGGIVCNIAMAVCLLLNKHAVADASPLHRPYWLGMIASNIAVVKMMDMHCTMFGVGGVCFLVGMAIVLVSLFSMGNSFAVTPMMSTIRTSSVYSVVRHPMYLGESIMVMACILSAASHVSLLLLIPYVFFTVMRIRDEERLLLESDQYRRYCARTRWRLFPGLW